MLWCHATKPVCFHVVAVFSSSFASFHQHPNSVLRLPTLWGSSKVAKKPANLVVEMSAWLQPTYTTWLLSSACFAGVLWFVAQGLSVTCPGDSSRSCYHQILDKKLKQKSGCKVTTFPCYPPENPGFLLCVSLMCSWENNVFCLHFFMHWFLDYFFDDTHVNVGFNLTHLALFVWNLWSFGVRR